MAKSLLNGKVYEMQGYWKNFPLLFLVTLCLSLVHSASIVNSKDMGLPQSPITFCTSDDCLRSAAHLKLSMNLSVNPCDNFYLYTCGRWIEQHPNYEKWPAFDGFDIIDQQVAKAEYAVLTANASDNSREELGISAIYQHLENADLPIIPSYISLSGEEMENFTFDWLRTEALLKQSMTVDVFIGTIVSVNIFNSSEYVIMVGTPDSETPLPSPPKEPEESVEDEERRNLTITVKTKIIKYILKKIVKDKTGERAEADKLQEAVDVILRIEEELAEIANNFSDPNAKMEDIRANNFSNLQNRIDELLSPPKPNLWLNYFNDLFNGTNVNFDPEKVSFLEDIQYIRIDCVMSKINMHNCTYIAYLNIIVLFSLLSNVTQKSTKPMKIWVEIMINNMRKAFMEHVHDITWMDKETKKLTIEKAEEILLYIGYPEWISRKDELDKYYADVIIEPDAYLANIISTVRSYNMKKLGSLRKKAVREWEPRDFDQSEAIKANAFYSPQHNAIEVPMVVLRYPMYRLGLELLNYGAVGAILGHEITHAFDNDGRKFDKFGNQRTWWSNDTIENFQNLTGCFIDHYEDISLEGVDGKINGTVTLGENIADNGGLRAAFNAYHHYEKTYGVEPKLPGFENFTTSQTFFIAYASAWCMELEPKMSLNEETDAHAPHYLRVLGTLQNSVDFSAAFQCPEGSFMNPKKKCNMW
ncbi:unnamed protein product [Phaedon cochleariae]|uniref:Uncharacterized protein n=1 Tax=Phaedon cochleariae TaxID=80249 RepID=A0A9N9X304_PHACE|nr:unnamed protein product [Phaedon cochleariae]